MNQQDKEYTFPNRQLLGSLTHSFASDLKAVKSHIAEGADINAKSLLDGETIFYKALDINIEEISDEVIIYLIENYQPDLNEYENDGITPLYMAMMENKVELVRFMLSKGADPLIICDSGLTIIDEARSERAFNDTEGNGIDFSEMVEVLENYLN
ncbi:ankyrin repeat domain-containing protein [Marivirga sp.]|uniref:ankyrin repeat domain-containing protein n=1 Tax=Marivirga sp. TaxID=2018662 RepID=UPI003DA75D78